MESPPGSCIGHKKCDTFNPTEIIDIYGLDGNE